MPIRDLTRGLALATLLGLSAAPAFAQETAPEAAPAEGAAAPAEELSMGTEAGAPVAPLTKETAAVGQAYLAANFELWEQRCEKTAEGTDPCQLFQLLKDAEGNAVAEFSIFTLPEGNKAVAGATVVVPLETLLTANMTIAIDESKAKIYPYTFCTQIGCVARIGFTAEEIGQFKKGAKATMTIVPTTWHSRVEHHQSRAMRFDQSVRAWCR